MTDKPIDLVLKALGPGNLVENGRTVKVKCPAHNDNNFSLEVREVENGKVIMHCFAGCDIRSVLDSLGLNMSDLFPKTN